VTAGDTSFKAIAFRLMPGADLKQSLIDYCVKQNVDAACVVSCVGSLQCAKIRFADRDEATEFQQKLEIVSLVGTASQHGCHLHISVSDGGGQVFGGHLMPGSLIYTTAEIVLGIIPNVVFKRELDESTGYRELKIEDVGRG
jgi:predicted DNA-binding protein with PD1-like motif